MIYFSAGKCLSFLYSKSPIARDKFKLPLTRPSTTYPPAAEIRDDSRGSSGLWSSDNAKVYYD
jgi:hypothetical protein